MPHIQMCTQISPPISPFHWFLFEFSTTKWACLQTCQEVVLGSSKEGLKGEHMKTVVLSQQQLTPGV
jgi:hypothetical protein